jgi:lycopene cyclase domain-containing protein
LLLFVLSVAIAADVLVATRPLVRQLGPVLLAVGGAVSVFVVLAEASIYRRLWGYNPVYILGISVPRRMPIEEVLTSFTFAVVAAIVWNLAGGSRNGAAGDGVPPEDLDPSPGAHRSRSVLVVGGLAGGIALVVAVLAVGRGFSHSSSGQNVRSRAGWRLAKLSDLFDYDLPDLTVFLGAVVAAIVIVNLAVLRTRVFSRRAGWAAITSAVVVSVVVDGWTSKTSSPIIYYAQDEFLSRFPLLDMPLEITLTRTALAALTVALLGRTTRHRSRTVATRRTVSAEQV